MIKSGIPIFILCALLSGCATYPQNEEDQATHHVGEARSALSKDNCNEAATNIQAALSRPSGITKVKVLLQGDQRARDCYYRHLENSIARVQNVSALKSVWQQIEVARQTDFFPPPQIGNLQLKLSETVTAGVASGSVPIVLGDDIDFLPELKSAENQKRIVEQSIAILQGKSEPRPVNELPETNSGRRGGGTSPARKSGFAVIGKRPIAGLMAYVKSVGVESAEGKRIQALLPTLNVRGNEIDLVSTLYPSFAAQRKDEIVARVHFRLKNGDRLLQDDILKALKGGVRGIDWMPSPGEKTTTLTVERVRNEEKAIPERTQTITYARAEVNLVNALLLMPNNSSYLYELVSGGAEIEYGFVVTAERDGKVVFDEVIRGNAGGEYRRCQNDRIQNVFGGVTSAGFVANDDMQRRCSGPASISMEDLRREILSKIVDGVLKVPTIKVAHQLN